MHRRGAEGCTGGGWRDAQEGGGGMHRRAGDSRERKAEPERLSSINPITVKQSRTLHPTPFHFHQSPSSCPAFPPERYPPLPPPSL